MLGVNVQYFTAQDPQEIDRALSEISVMGPGGLVVESDANLVSNRAKIIDFVARHRLPTVYGNLDYIPDGGVMAYFTASSRPGGGWQHTSTASSREPNLATVQSSKRSNLNLS